MGRVHLGHVCGHVGVEAESKKDLGSLQERELSMRKSVNPTNTTEMGGLSHAYTYKHACRISGCLRASLVQLTLNALHIAAGCLTRSWNCHCVLGTIIVIGNDYTI